MNKIAVEKVALMSNLAILMSKETCELGNNNHATFDKSILFTKTEAAENTQSSKGSCDILSTRGAGAE